MVFSFQIVLRKFERDCQIMGFRHAPLLVIQEISYFHGDPMVMSEGRAFLSSTSFLFTMVYAYYFRSYLGLVAGLVFPEPTTIFLVLIYILHKLLSG